MQVLNDYEDDNALESPYKKVIKYIIHLASFSGPLAQVQFKSWEGAWERADKVAKNYHQDIRLKPLVLPESVSFGN